MRPSFLRGIALTTLIAVATPGIAADRRDRAREAVAAARAKVETAGQLGAAGDVPRLQAEARAALRAAEEAFDHKKEGDAIAAANRAQELAETAIGVSQRNQVEAQAAVQAGAQADAAAAQNRAAAAEDQAIAANARADSAERAANAAAADAAAARATVPVATTTTVQTEAPAPRTATVARKRVVAKRVVRKPVRRATTTVTRPATVKTTTTVTTTPQ